MANKQILKGVSNSSYVYQEAPDINNPGQVIVATVGIDSNPDTIVYPGQWKVVVGGDPNYGHINEGQFSIDPYGDIYLRPAAGFNVVLPLDGLTISNNNINMINTIQGGGSPYPDVVGQITSSGHRFIHNYAGETTGNTFVGQDAGNFNFDANAVIHTSAFGHETLLSLTIGHDNCAFGYESLINVTEGNNNVSIGASAGGVTTTGSNNIFIGFESGSAVTNTADNNILIANDGVAAESNAIRIGSSHTSCYIDGIAGVNVGDVATVVSINSDQLGEVELTSNTGIIITPSANTINFALDGALAVLWSIITVDQFIDPNFGYICNKAGTLVLTLPSNSAVGDIVEVTGINNATGWSIAQQSGQQIFFGASSTTLGTSGSLTSSATRDSIRMVCIATNTTWQVLSSVGNITVV